MQHVKLKMMLMGFNLESCPQHHPVASKSGHECCQSNNEEGTCQSCSDAKICFDFPRNFIPTGGILREEAFIESRNSQIFAILQLDGNFVVYRRVESGNEVLWSSETSNFGQGDFKLNVNCDGLVETDSNDLDIYRSPFEAEEECDGYLMLFDDGLLAFFNGYDKIWEGGQGQADLNCPDEFPFPFASGSKCCKYRVSQN